MTMTDSSDQTQYLTFFVGGEEYALGILQVKEIIEYGTVTRVPITPDYVRGVINLRGSVVPVVDLGVKLGLPPSEISKWSCIVIVELTVEGELMVLGILVDTMGQVVQLFPKDIEKPPAFGTRARASCLRGMGKMDGKFVMILDLDQVLGCDVEGGLAPLRPLEPAEEDPARLDALPAQ